MAIYEFANDHLAKVDMTSFSSEGILERYHLQMALKDQIEIIYLGHIKPAEQGMDG